MGKGNNKSKKKGTQVGYRVLEVTQVTDTSITIKWEKLSEEEAAGTIRYQVGICEWDNPDDEWTTVEIKEGIDSNTFGSYTFTGLKPKTKYGFYVEALDEHDVVLCTYPDDPDLDYHLEQETLSEDNQAPTVKDRTIYVSDKSNTGFTISWKMANDKVTTDPKKIRYRVGLYEYNNPEETFSYVKDEPGISSCVFTDLKPDTEYGFYVEAFDEAGNMLRYPSIDKDMTFKTLPTDSKPPQIDKKSLRVTETKDTSIIIRWERAQDNLTPTYEIHYQVRIKEANKSKVEERIVTDEPGIASFEITDLKPETKYLIYVDAIDSVGNKSTYKELSVNTKATDNVAPQVASHDLKVTEITDTGFTISWKRATDKMTPDDKIRYVVKIIDYDSDELSRIAEDAVKIDSYTFTDLKPETKYGVWVEAFDEAGNVCSYPDEEIGYLIVTTKVTDKEAPKVKSKKLAVSDVTTKSFVVSWEKATDDVTLAADMRYHVVLVKMEDSEDPIIDETKTDIDTYTFTGLEPETQYAVLVEAYDEVGNNVQYTTKDNEPVMVTTLEEKDTEKPTLSSNVIKASDITETSVTLSWQAATDNKTAQAEIKYDVYQDSNCIKHDLTSASNSVTYKVEDLKPGKTYNFHVVAKDKAGNSVTYPTKAFETADTTAPTVNSLEISASKDEKSKSVKLSWQAAKDNATAPLEIEYDVYQNSSLIQKGLKDTSYTVSNLVLDTEYSFYVVARDKANNETRYNTKIVEIKDTEKITLPSSVIDKSIDKENKSVTLSWKAAEKNNKTAPAEIKYYVYQGDDCIKEGLTSYSDPVTYKVENLKYGIYVFHVVAKDGKGNEARYDKTLVAFSKKSINIVNDPNLKPIVNGPKPNFHHKKKGSSVSFQTMTAITAVNKVVLEVKNKVTVYGGEVRCKFEWISNKYDSNGRLVEAEPQEDCVNFSLSKSINSVKTIPIELPEGCFFNDNEIKLTIMSRMTYKVGNWKTAKSGYLDVSGGKIQLLIKGSVLYAENIALGGDAKDGYARFK